MDIFAELERVTSPSFAAGPVHCLTLEEIAAVTVTPLTAIPLYHWRPRLSMPDSKTRKSQASHERL